MSGGSGDVSLSIEETNKLRISLGLKPLQVDGDDAGGTGESASKDDDAEAEENYTQYRQRQKDDVARTTALDRIARNRNKRLLNARLAGATLASERLADEVGAGGTDVDDPLSWVKRSRQRQVELAERRRKEQEEADLKAQEDAKREYVVSGVRVGHKADDLVDAG
ncbi:hypothetical protein HDU93_007694, partial [Gonapodya sp. JEL0774]